MKIKLFFFFLLLFSAPSFAGQLSLGLGSELTEHPDRKYGEFRYLEKNWSASLGGHGKDFIWRGCGEVHKVFFQNKKINLDLGLGVCYGRPDLRLDTNWHYSNRFELMGKNAKHWSVAIIRYNTCMTSFRCDSAEEDDIKDGLHFIYGRRRW